MKKGIHKQELGEMWENRIIFPERAEKCDKANSSNRIATCSIAYYVEHLYLSV